MAAATKTRPLSWRPRRRGDTYCAPACGHGCKRAAFEAAERKAKRLAAKLGKGWRPRVWENLGWHYSATRPHLAVHPSVDGGYTAFLNRRPKSSGGHWTAYYATPAGAVLRVITAARMERDAMVSLLAVLDRPPV